MYLFFVPLSPYIPIGYHQFKRINNKTYNIKWLYNVVLLGFLT